MIDTQPNERRCERTQERHILPVPPCCPVSHNPRPGSEVEIRYTAGRSFLEVEALKEYIDTFKSGKGDVRSMEGMIQTIAQDCADTVRTPVDVIARLEINPNQQMVVECHARPRSEPNE